MNFWRRLITRAGLHDIPRGVWAGFLVEATVETGFSISFTYLALYFHTARGLAMTAAGTIIFVSGLLSGVFQMIGGAVADRYGHRRMLLYYLVFQITAFALLAFLVASGGPLWSVILLAVAVPMAGGPILATNAAAIADSSREERLTESFGLIAIAGNIGWAIGPLVGGLLLKSGSYGWLFGIGAIV